jgi:hypothetical protein
MTRCIVYACPHEATDGELCSLCRLYLRHGVGDHPTLIRPAWELVPRLDTVYRALTIKSSELMRQAAMGTLERLLADLKRRKA